MFNHNNVDNLQICMDIPFVDHPYLIGPRGRKCQHLMDRYKSLIHFPDSNRRIGGPKLNNVLINGSMKNAEEIRVQLRNRTPIRLAIQLQHFTDVLHLVRLMETAISDRSLPIRLNYSDDYTSGLLKTEWRNEDLLVKFCDEFLMSNNNSSPTTAVFVQDGPDVFTIAVTILPLINPWNSEISHWLIEHIYELTGCRVYYPPKEKFSDQPPSYFIKGSTAAGVLQAGRFLMGLTMFQVSFVLPHTFQMSQQKFDEWQNDLLVHVTIEPVYRPQNNEFSHEKAILRSFEFCVNNVYIVRSLMLGFKKSIQTSGYDFMNSAKQFIPNDVFSTSQLYFPLYAIDDERSFDWNISGDEFIKQFYGGPYSLRNFEETYNKSLTSRLQALMNIEGSDGAAIAENEDYNNNPPTDNNSSLEEDFLTLQKNKKKNKNLTNTVKSKNLRNSSRANDSLRSPGSSFNSTFNQTKLSSENVHDGDSGLCVEQARGGSPLSSHYNSMQSSHRHLNCLKSDTSATNTTLQNTSGEASRTGTARGGQPSRVLPPLYQRLSSRSSHLNSSGDERFGSSNVYSNSTSTPLPNSRSAENLVSASHPIPTLLKEVEKEQGIHEKLPAVSAPDTFNGDGISPHFAFTSSSIAATSTSVLDHEDDPELQAILRQTMPCLQVTKEQLDKIDHEAKTRAILAADSLARLSNPFIQPFSYNEYAVSYPTEGSIFDLDDQFYAFLRQREHYYAQKADQQATSSFKNEGDTTSNPIIVSNQVRKGRENGAKASETLASVVAAAVGATSQTINAKPPTTLAITATMTGGHRKSASF